MDTSSQEVIPISDATYSYWEQTDELFQEKLTQRQEFRELMLPSELEAKPQRGEYYKQQLLVARFLQIWDFILIDHAPGVGKTDAGVLASEKFRIGSSMDPSTAYRHGLCNFIDGTDIFTPSSTVDITWITSYERRGEGQSVPSNVRIHHFEEFYKKYATNMSGAVKELNHKFIIWDEVQKALSRSKTNREERDRYDFYVKLFSLIPVMKMMLATGSLLTIDTIELAYTVNIFPRGIDLKMPEDDSWHSTLKTATNDDRDAMLRPYLNGLVSRLKSVPKYARAVSPDDSIDIGVQGSQFYKVVELNMSPAHSKVYRKAAENHPEFNQGALQYSVFGLNVKPGHEDKLTAEQIKTYGPIIDRAAQIVQANPNKKIFIVVHWISHGILPMKRALDLLGYSSINKEAKGSQGRKGIFPETIKRRYGILESSGESKVLGDGSIKSSGQNSGIIDYFNRDRNAAGDFLQVILSSEVGTTSISLYGAQMVLLLDPGAQLQIDLQREERVFRTTSHQHLYAMRRATGMSHEDAIVPVMVYHFSINDPLSIGTPLYSATMSKYRDNAIRDLALDPTRHSEQRLALDAQLFEARNRLSEDIQGEYHPGFYGVDVRKKPIDTSAFDIVYSDLSEDVLLSDLVILLSDAYTINVDLFVESYTRGRKILPDKVYRNLAKLLTGPRLITSSLGERLYIHLNSRHTQLYISPEKFTTNANHTLAIYSNPHQTLLSRDLTRTTETIIGFTVWDKFEEFLDQSINDVQNKTLTDRIAKIEAVLLRGSSHEFYDKLLKKYPRAIRIIVKPVDMIIRLSGLQKAKRKAALDMPLVETTVDAENVLMHVFRSQRDLQRGGSYNILAAHTATKWISVIDSTTHNFVTLEIDGPEHIAYSRIMGMNINDHFEGWVNDYRNTVESFAMSDEEELTIGQQRVLAMRDLYGVFFRPENVFRLQDNRDRPIIHTTAGEINKSLIAKTKKHFSYNIEDFLDMIVYLRIEEDFLMRIRGNYDKAIDDFYSQLELLRGSSYDKIMRLIAKEIPDDAKLGPIMSQLPIEGNVVLNNLEKLSEEDFGPVETVKGTTRMRKNRSSIMQVLALKEDYYRRHLHRFAAFYLLYKNKDKHDSPVKEDHSSVIQNHLRNNDRIYEFR